mmetsp:Transcript_776/g.2266  ORF Transcript_776/g.2266 Transcript_776/m.2266 type:complete len:329 (-) Transcript_776:575-1561(-)
MVAAAPRESARRSGSARPQASTTTRQATRVASGRASKHVDLAARRTSSPSLPRSSHASPRMRSSASVACLAAAATSSVVADLRSQSQPCARQPQRSAKPSETARALASAYDGSYSSSASPHATSSTHTSRTTLASPAASHVSARTISSAGTHDGSRDRPGRRRRAKGPSSSATSSSHHSPSASRRTSSPRDLCFPRRRPEPYASPPSQSLSTSLHDEPSSDSDEMPHCRRTARRTLDILPSAGLEREACARKLLPLGGAHDTDSGCRGKRAAAVRGPSERGATARGEGRSGARPRAAGREGRRRGAPRGTCVKGRERGGEEGAMRRAD